MGGVYVWGIMSRLDRIMCHGSSEDVELKGAS
jgi:hypothetical protein